MDTLTPPFGRACGCLRTLHQKITPPRSTGGRPDSFLLPGYLPGFASVAEAHSAVYGELVPFLRPSDKKLKNDLPRKNSTLLAPKSPCYLNSLGH